MRFFFTRFFFASFSSPSSPHGAISRLKQQANQLRDAYLRRFKAAVLVLVVTKKVQLPGFHAERRFQIDRRSWYTDVVILLRPSDHA